MRVNSMMTNQNPEKSDKYRFSKRLNRLQRVDDKDYIKSLFDKPEEVDTWRGRYQSYRGRIAGIEVRLDIRKNHTPLLWAETKGKVEKAHKNISSKLLE